LARLSIAAGYDVVLSNSRGPETLKDLIGELGSRARAATPAGAAEAGDIIVVTVPLRAYSQMPVQPLAGKIVIDTNNYYPQRDGVFPELENASTTVSELLQKHLANSKVVKTFNSIYYRHLASLPRPKGAKDRSALPLVGDDADAKRQVAAFLDAIGFDAIDVGPLREGWRFERDTPAYCFPYADPSTEKDDIGFPRGGKPAGVDVIKAKVAEAKRR
jgi:predicted dinucleotide-binding enzyme